jgi:peptidoglycan/xylan/chitin deacetylase (PgdA/CDA1 family)
MHHVCNAFDAESMNKGDWMQIDDFNRKVLTLRENGAEFISLTETYNKITNDKWRNNKYAVLTFDDGYASLKEILPWLEEQQIPATLFINGKYLDGKSFRDNPKEQYLNKEELFALTSPFIEIGSHGWEHLDASKISADEFKLSTEQ